MSATSQPTTFSDIKLFGKTCIVAKCQRNNIVGTSGLCHKHYQYNKRHGYPEIATDKSEPLVLSDRDAAWLAAVIDCEGWIGMFKSARHNGVAYWAAIGVGNTNPILTTKLRQLTGLGRVSGVQPRNHNAKYKYVWMVNRHDDVRSVLLAVLPHLLLKSEQAHLLLSLPPKNTKAGDFKAAVKDRLTVLNKKGVV